MKTDEKTVQELGTVQDQFPSFIEFERAWHEWAKTTLKEASVLYELLYNEGRYDHVPYDLWDDNVTDWKRL